MLDCPGCFRIPLCLTRLDWLTIVGDSIIAKPLANSRPRATKTPETLHVEVGRGGSLPPNLRPGGGAELTGSATTVGDDHGQEDPHCDCVRIRNPMEIGGHENNHSPKEDVASPPPGPTECSEMRPDLNIKTSGVPWLGKV